MLFRSAFHQNGTATLVTSITNNSTTPIVVDSTSSFPSSGYILIGTEIIQYTATTTTTFADTRVAGTISSNPAYLMNADLYQGQPVALRGRVPVNVVGKVKKGDLLVTGNVAGYATSVGNDKKYGPAIFAKSLNDKDDTDPGTIEAVIL